MVAYLRESREIKMINTQQTYILHGRKFVVMSTTLRKGKTFKYVGLVNNKIGRGVFSSVYVGQFKSDPVRPWETYDQEVKAAIKRVELFGKSTYSEIENDREVIALKKLNHPYIVRLFAVEDDKDFRNFVFELCQANLEEFISKKYSGAMPQELEGLFHIASGLEYIHENQMIHRDIKPENVLISVTENGKARLKIADFEFTKKIQDKGSHFDVVSGLKGTEYYLAAELLRLRNRKEKDLNNDCTTATDVFATGITFFRFLFGELHPFGVGYKIEESIIKGDPINLIQEISRKTKPEWLTLLVKNMIQLEIKKRLSIREVVDELKSKLPNLKSEKETNVSTPTQVITVEGNPLEMSDTRVVGNQGLKFNIHNTVGRGYYAVIFEGYFRNEKVAIKRVQMDDNLFNQEVENLRKLSHPNVIRLIHFENDYDFGYMVLELCDASMDKLFLEDGDPKKYTGPMPTDEQVLFQLASGLHHMHSMNVVHGDITPQIVLIFRSKTVQLKWGGFGISRTVTERESFSSSQNDGTKEKLESESIINLTSVEDIGDLRFTKKTDIFKAGCVFFYFLLKGVHPFGSDRNDIAGNIIEGNPINFKDFPNDHFAHGFIRQMIDHDPAKRIPLGEVIDCLKPLQPKIRLSSMSYNHQNMLFRRSFSKVYRVLDFEGKSLAVKIVDYFSTENFEKLKELNHPNILQFYYFEQEDDSSYIGMELCDASLDMFFLSDGDPRKYGGPMPSNEEFCFQLASGLQYIHMKKLVHGSIKPSNILVKGSNIKLSDFGLTGVQWNDGQMSSSAIGGFQNAHFWLAPELIEMTLASDINFVADLHQFITEKSDIFAAGCVSFYFFSKGRHLFGDEIHSILPNIVEGNRANLPTYELNKTDCILMLLERIKSMTEKLPNNRLELSKIIEELEQPFQPENLHKVGDNISYTKNRILGDGGQAFVFLGFFNETQVAVKRFRDMDVLEKESKEKVYRERENFKKLVHPNILKFYGDAETETFLFLALERCLISLDSYCQKSLPYRDLIPMPSQVQVLLQMAQGLEFIHQKGIIHRDVKPANILISFDNPAVIKWADFGLSRAVTTGSKTFTWSKLKGTERWMAPELIGATEEEKIKGSIKCDIFALGCVFFFFLQSGNHPFGTGDKHLVQHNIKEGKRINFDVFRGKHDAYKLIEGMTEKDRELRVQLPMVIDSLKSFPIEHIEKQQQDGASSGSTSKISTPYDKQQLAPPEKKRKRR